MSDVDFQADRPLTDEQFRALSPRSVIAFVLGLVSGLMLVSSFFLVVPLAAVTLGVSAVRQVRMDPKALGGRGLAIAGIVLATFFSSASSVRFFTMRQLIVNDAVRHVDFWFELIAQGQAIKAVELNQRPSGRQPFDVQLKNDLIEFSHKTQLDQFWEDVPTQISQFARSGNPRFEKLLNYSWDTRDYRIVLRYQLDCQSDEGSETLPLDVTVYKQIARDSSHSPWGIESVKLAK